MTTKVWVNAKEAQQLFCLQKYQLENMVAAGHIRAAKADPAKRGSSRLYKVADIDDYLCNQSKPVEVEA